MEFLRSLLFTDICFEFIRVVSYSIPIIKTEPSNANGMTGWFFNLFLTL